MTIVEAKRELYMSIRDHDDISGAGICMSGDKEIIKVFLARETDMEIPEMYDGFVVETEVIGTIYLQ